MNEKYLPIEESQGYKNVKKALWNIFLLDLDDFEIIAGEYENFGFEFTYNEYTMMMWISSTGKNKQFEYGEGGRFIISLPNPDYPDRAFFKNIYFHNLLIDKKYTENAKYSFGADIKKIEATLLDLKKFLDSNDAKILTQKQ